MHHRFAKVILGIVAASALPIASRAQTPAPAAAAAQESPYADQDEYQMATAAGKETDPQKKLDLLKQWEQKYPNAKLKGQRTLMQAQALLGMALAAFGKPGPPEVLDAGQKAAQQVLDNLNTYFAAENKPAQATDAQWAEIRHTFELQAHSVLGWVAMTKHQDAAAEDEFKKILALNPNDAQTSYSLGSVIIRQKNIARYSEALYDIARALSVKGDGALPPAAQQQYDAYLKKAYAGYHGDTAGLDELKASVSTSALPPAGFHIESVEEIEKKKFADQKGFDDAHPDIALWRQIRDALKADTGEAYFQQAKGSAVPPEKIGMFKGKVVTVDPKDLIVNVDNAGGDVTLKFESALNAKAIEVGAAIEFKGVVDSFAKEPYMLTLLIDDPKADIKGLPATAFSGAAPVRRPGAKKTGPKKK